MTDHEWLAVPARALAYAEAAGPVVAGWLAKFAAAGSRPEALWYDPAAGRAYVPAAAGAGAWDAALAGVLDRGDAPTPPGFGERAWLPVKTAAGAFRPLFDAAQLTPTRANALAGGPTPVAASVAGGLLGAGLGYAGGWLGEKAFGRDVLEPGRLRRTLALAGGLLGALPGAYLGTVGARLNAEDGRNPAAALVEPNALLGKEGGDARFAKAADEAGALFVPSIPVDAFNRVVWADPNTPPGVRAGVTGLVEGAAALRGGAALVSPYDVGRIAAGMGSGLVSGMLVGKALGALAGLTPDAQQALKRTGVWAGALMNVVPRVFGF